MNNNNINFIHGNLYELSPGNQLVYLFSERNEYYELINCIGIYTYPIVVMSLGDNHYFRSGGSIYKVLWKNIICYSCDYKINIKELKNESI